MEMVQMLHLVIALGSVEICDSSGKLSIHLLKYSNKKHKLEDGGCCDNTGWFGCSNPCDNYFVICVTEIAQPKCNLGKIQTKVLGQDTLTFPGVGGDLGSGNKNPLVFNFATWKGFDLSIDVWDSEDNDPGIHGNNDFVDTIDLDIQDTPDPDSQSATTTRIRAKSSTSPSDRYLDLNVKVYCDTNYLVPDCSRQCVARDDDQGHYTCDYVNGKIDCKENWYGDRCTKYCRPRNDSYANYTCDSFGEKNCSNNWFGGNCSQYCEPRNDETGHYYCEKNTGRKICSTFWFGEDCLTYCAGRDDPGGHYSCNQRTGEKVCLQDWFGVNCTRRCSLQDDMLLGHSTCDVTGNKVCLPGWRGENCTEKIDRTRTVNILQTLNFANSTSFLHSSAIQTNAVPSLLKTRIPSRFNSQLETLPFGSSTSRVISENEQTKTSSSNHITVSHITDVQHTNFISMFRPPTNIAESRTIQNVPTLFDSFPNFQSVTPVTTDGATQPTKSSNKHSLSFLFTDPNYGASEAHYTTPISSAAFSEMTESFTSTSTGKQSHAQMKREKSSYISVRLTSTDSSLAVTSRYVGSPRISSVETKSIYTRKTSVILAGSILSVFSSVIQPSSQPVTPFTTLKNPSNTERLLKPSFQSNTASFSHLTVFNHSLNVSAKPTKNVEGPTLLSVELVNPDSKSKSSINTVAVRQPNRIPTSAWQTMTDEGPLSASEIYPSSTTWVQSKSFTSSLVTQTIKIFLHLQTEWQQAEETQLEMLLQKYIKTINRDKVNDYFKEVHVTTIKTCRNMVLLDADISLLKAGRDIISQKQFSRDIKILIKRTFNTSDVILGNDTEGIEMNCDSKSKEQRGNNRKLLIILVLVVSMLLSSAVVLAVCVRKIKRRTCLSRKIHPECFSLQTKKKEEQVSTSPKTPSGQNLLYLEEL